MTRSWHYLALQLGGTVAELQARLSYREWVDWCAYFELAQAEKPMAQLPPPPAPAPVVKPNPILSKFRSMVNRT